MIEEITLTLNSPITEEQLDAITDVDFEHTDRIWFKTKHGKEVEFVKRKNGLWIKNEGRFGWHCSECKVDNYYAYVLNSETGKNDLQDRYCPSCGAEMLERRDDG